MSDHRDEDTARAEALLLAERAEEPTDAPELDEARLERILDAVEARDAATVAATQQHELDTVKNSYLIKKLGLENGPHLDEAINAVIETYGRSERNKYRAVVYYMLCRHFGKESVYA